LIRLLQMLCQLRISEKDVKFGLILLSEAVCGLSRAGNFDESVETLDEINERIPFRGRISAFCSGGCVR